MNRKLIKHTKPLSQSIRVVKHWDRIGWSLVEIDDDLIDALVNLPGVEIIHDDMQVGLCLEESTPKTQAPDLWKMGYDGRGVRVGIIDTGIDPDHPAVRGRIVAAKDFTGGDYPHDGHGHGTHVAGIIGGAEAPNVGMAPGCSFIVAKALTDDGWGYMSWILDAMEWCASQGAAVISMSLGAQDVTGCKDAMAEMTNSLADEGIVMSIAAGNSGPSPRTIGTPGCAEKCICVGAVDKSDQIAEFSSRGPTSDGRTKPDIVAYGVDINSAKPGGGYQPMSGTSMATPHISGAVALLLHARPHASGQAIKEAIMKGALDLGHDANTQGAGVIRVKDALDHLPGPTEQPDIDVPETHFDVSLKPGEYGNVSVLVRNTGNMGLVFDRLQIDVPWIQGFMPPPIAPGGQNYVALRIEAGHEEGTWGGRVVFHTNDPDEMPVVTVTKIVGEPEPSPGWREQLATVLRILASFCDLVGWCWLADILRKIADWLDPKGK